jgi:hypothetical protein
MKIFIKKTLSVVIILSIVSFFSLTNFLIAKAQASTGFLSSARVQLGDSRPSQTGVTYTTMFTPAGTTGIQCMNIVFATAADMTGGVPATLTTTSAVKGTIVGGGLTDGDWSLYVTGNNGTLQYEALSAKTTSATTITIPTTTITNTSAAIFYAQITTYSTLTSHTCSNIVDQSNVIALITLAGVTTNVTVQPTLTFSVTNDGAAVNGSGDSTFVTTTASTIPLGIVAAGATAQGSQTLTISTNATHGYTLYLRDSQALTDAAGDTIPDQPGTPTASNSFNGSTTQSSFGYTADGNGTSFGSNKWAGLTQTNVVIASRSAAISADATHAEFKVEISNVQPPGTYATVISYTATPSY